MKVGAYLEITMQIPAEKRADAAKVYADFRGPFLENIPGALTKELLVRDEDVQVLHGFATVEDAQAYLESPLFNDDVAVGLQPTWSAAPDVRIYPVVA